MYWVGLLLRSISWLCTFSALYPPAPRGTREGEEGVHGSGWVLVRRGRHPAVHRGWGAVSGTVTGNSVSGTVTGSSISGTVTGHSISESVTGNSISGTVTGTQSQTQSQGLSHVSWLHSMRNQAQTQVTHLKNNHTLLNTRLRDSHKYLNCRLQYSHR